MRIAILGAGKMGSWLAGQLAEGNEIAVFDMDAKKAAEVENARVLNSMSELSGFAPELLINAVSLQNTKAAFEAALPFLPKTCLIGDVASIKGDLPEYYARCGFRSFSVHPMFGPTFANMESLHEENAVIISESDGKADRFFTKFFSRLGLKIRRYSFREHDQMMAYSLTTPFVTSLVFASCVDENAVPGTTFARHRKIARGLLSEDDWLLCEILFNSYSLPQLEKISSRLEFIKHVIKGKDYEEARKFIGKLRKNVG